MKVDIQEANGVYTAILTGWFDTNEATQFLSDIQPLFDHADQQLVLDCGGLEYICSLGLRILLRLNKESAAKNGHLQLTNMNGEIRKIFEMTGFEKLFYIH